MVLVVLKFKYQYLSQTEFHFTLRVELLNLLVTAMQKAVEVRRKIKQTLRVLTT